MKTAIIGSGIAGIAAAVRLRHLGHDVTIYEANSYPGGKLSEIVLTDSQGGKYRFDAGPSLFTLPELVEEIFTLTEKNTHDHFEYERLDPITRYFYEDGTVIDAHAEPEKFAREIAGKTTDQAATVLKFLKKSREKYDITAEVFLRSSLHRASTYLNVNTFKSMLQLSKLDVFRSMNQANETTFKDPRVVQLFNRYATYNGSDPYQTPATLNIIPHLEYNIGAFFPKKGMHDIALSLLKLAESMGVRLVLNARVDEIIVSQGKEGKKATGIRTGDKIKNFDLVVSNMDVVNTYRRLLPGEKSPEKILTQPKSSSALIFYWGINCAFPGLELHNIFFSGNYREEFRQLFEQQTIGDDPTVYVCVSSKPCPADAPEGCENWFTMINVPNNTGQDWDALIEKSRQNIIAKLSRMLSTDLKAHIVCEAILDPRSIESKTSSSLGALYGNSSNNRYAAFFRHANFSDRIKGLYFCGGSVHPGGGIPLSLLSARIVARLVEEETFKG